MFGSIRTTVVTALVIGAVAPASTALAMPASDVPTTNSSLPASDSSLPVVLDDRFDWGDAAVGAAGGLGVLVLAGSTGLVAAGRRRQRRAIRVS